MTRMPRARSCEMSSTSPEEWCAWARGPNKERLEDIGVDAESVVCDASLSDVKYAG